MRRGDCTGKLYVRVIGGYLVGADDDLRAVDCCIGIEDEEAEERLAGRRVAGEDELPRRQDHSYLKQEFGNGADAWWFGSLASPCEAGAACADPASCTQCTRQQTYKARPREASTSEVSASENLLFRVMRKNHFWRKSRPSAPAAPSLARAPSTAGPGSESETEQVETTFCAKEFGVDVNDYFGRLPVTFRVWREGTKETPNGGREQGRKSSRHRKKLEATDVRRLDLSHSLDSSGHEKSKRATWSLNLLGSGTARLADGLANVAPLLPSPRPPPIPAPSTTSSSSSPSSTSSSSMATSSLLPSFAHPASAPASSLATSPDRWQSVTQIVRLTNADEQITGCLLVNIRFVQARSKDLDMGPLLHSAVENGQVKLAEILISSLRRKAQAQALTWRSPINGDMNAYELAARLGQTRVLHALLHNTSSNAWNTWTSSSPKHGLTALHMAVLGNSATAAQALLDHARKQELTTSLFDSGGFDYLTEMGGTGLERHRNLASHAKNVMLKATDDQGRTPFALACGLALPQDPMLVVLSLSQLGASISTTDNEGNTPLMASIRAGQTAVACALLEMTEEGPPGVAISRACPNMPNSEGLRPLHVAAKLGNLMVVQALLEAGALSALRSSAGSTPLHFAARHGHLEVVRALVDWPAQFAAREEEQYLEDQQRRAAQRGLSGAGSSPSGVDADVRAQIEADASLAAAFAAMEEGLSLFQDFYGDESDGGSRRRRRQRHEAFTVPDLAYYEAERRRSAAAGRNGSGGGGGRNQRRASGGGGGAADDAENADESAAARFQRLHRARDRFSRLVGRVRQRRHHGDMSPPSESAGETEEMAVSDPTVGPAAGSSASAESQARTTSASEDGDATDGGADRRSSDATFIATDDEEDNGEDEEEHGEGAGTGGADADVDDDPDHFGGVAMVNEEKVKFKGVSRREALAHRDPGVEAVEWSTGLTPAQIAKSEGHSDVHEYLASLVRSSSFVFRHRGPASPTSKPKAAESPKNSSGSEAVSSGGAPDCTESPQDGARASDDGRGSVWGPAETEIGTDEYYEYPFMDADLN